MAFDSKEYTRLRDIVRKRNIRLSEAGLAPLAHFPTVKEIKAGFATPSEALKAVKEYYSGGSTVKAVRQTGLVPEIKYFPEMPKPDIKPEISKAERKREQDRAYRRRKAVKQLSQYEGEQKRYVGYLKSLETVINRWKEGGMDLGIRMEDMTPSEAKGFVEYIEYRFAQADFKKKYIIDVFIEDYADLKKKGYTGKEIISDFNNFLEEQHALKTRKERMEGVSSKKFKKMWSKYKSLRTGE